MFADSRREFGAGTQTRTEDLLITNQLLYQLSYASKTGIVRYLAREDNEENRVLFDLTELTTLKGCLNDKASE